MPKATLGPDGQSATATTIPVNVNGLLNLNVLNGSAGPANASSSNFGTATEQITASAGVAGDFSILGVNLLNALNVTAVTSTCTSNAQGSTGATTFVGLNGNPIIPGTVLPTSALGPLGALISVTVGGEVTSDTTATATTPGNTSITVTALQIKLLGTTIVINAGVSSCSATGPDIHPAAVAAPNITSITPSSGPVAGGQSVAIAGTNLQNASSVTFGGVAATITGPGTADTSTLLTVINPPHAAGAVPVTVTTPGGTASITFTYVQVPPPPVTDTFTPLFGPVAGGTAVTITGSGLAGTTVVTFGGTAATNIINTSDSSITVTDPTHAAGAVPVTVTTAGGTSTLNQLFTYVDIPVVTSFTPTSGPTVGGTLVTITGSNFAGPTTVVFGTTPGTDVTVVSPTEITVISPAHAAGPVFLTLADFGGVVTPTQAFTYLAGPVVLANGLNPAYGPVGGGTVVTITGTGLTNTTAVTFGGAAGTSIVNSSDTSITVTTPAHVAGAVTVTITANGQTANAVEEFTYVGVPVINADGLNPTSGPTSGGTPVTITGSGFVPGDPTTVTFDTSAATSVVVVSPTEITALSPAHALGAVPVTVTDDGGRTVAPQQFNYVVGATIAGISPTSGPQQGGETVFIGGTNLCGSTAVHFGSAAATITNISTDCSTITVTEPPGDGTVHVTVTTPTGTIQSPVDFTYIQPGYWEAAGDGGVFSFGGALFHGSVPGVLQPGQSLNSPIIAMADTPDHGGYWLFAADGGVFAFGDAPFLGSVPGVLKPGQVLNGPVVAAEATPDGLGYREFAADGGVFDFGDALFTGSLPGEDITPPSPITAAISAPIGQGYWLAAANGGIYTFGGAPNNGSAAGAFFGHVSSLSTTPDGHGLYLFLSSGAVGHLGDAIPGLGGASGSSPTVFGESTSTGKGYWEFAANGIVSSFGDAPALGSINIALNKPITAGIAFGSD
ncbi:MAG TPA: IPT/TIG domain-containing protein [Acidimicrobiales bacterium]|nr:IPT/TIG domain-containing protein [Acidimicrobiales bacterium]